MNRTVPGRNTIGLYPFREGLQSFYPQIPAHYQTWKLRSLDHIPPGRGSEVFIHGSLHISRHGNSVHWPISPPGRGTGVFIHGSLHISGHGNSIHWPVFLQEGALEFLSSDPCTFLDMETPSFGLYSSRKGHWSFYPWIPAHFQTWKLCLLAHIPPGRGTRVFIHGPLHISRHGNSICWPISLQGGALEFLSTDPWGCRV